MSWWVSANRDVAPVARKIVGQLLNQAIQISWLPPHRNGDPTLLNHQVFQSKWTFFFYGETLKCCILSKNCLEYFKSGLCGPNCPLGPSFAPENCPVSYHLPLLIHLRARPLSS